MKWWHTYTSLSFNKLVFLMYFASNSLHSESRRAEECACVSFWVEEQQRRRAPRALWTQMHTLIHETGSQMKWSSRLIAQSLLDCSAPRSQNCVRCESPLTFLQYMMITVYFDFITFRAVTTLYCTTFRTWSQSKSILRSDLTYLFTELSLRSSPGLDQV